MCLYCPDYVAEIYTTLTTTPRAELKTLVQELKASTPEPFHSMLDKESKEDATKKYLARKQQETEICPPTCSNEELQRLLQQATQTAETQNPRRRRQPICKKCEGPVKGHKIVNRIRMCPPKEN
ncbi:uncharacterized protein LOC110238744 [Exaiptasia diaphana]|uniref:Uncharacterized protein n=1 Tax=Exaiptasia diaphana TaxID=2652724 RepID=A0A913YJU1_EXADI|nr:uncharacterized protein LOC110238744 [Exaiptasia diaphana]